VQMHSYASPRTGDSTFVTLDDHWVPNTFRIADRLDLAPKLPLPPLYDHVLGLYEVNAVQLLPVPPKILVKPTSNPRYVPALAVPRLGRPRAAIGWRLRAVGRDSQDG
jgi:hypothetical protein